MTHRSKFFKTFYTFKHTIEQSMRSSKYSEANKVCTLWNSSEEVFQNNIHNQTYSWTKYALSESTVSGGLQAEPMASEAEDTHSNIQLNEVCAQWKYSFLKHRNTLYTFKHTIEQSMRSVKVHLAEWWASSRSNGFQKKFFETLLYIEQSMIEITLSGGLQAEAIWRNFLKHFTQTNIRLNKLCALWKYTEWWAWSRSNDSQKKFFKTFYTFKHTIEQSLRSVNVHWVVGFKRKQWLSGEIFQNIIHIQTHNWTNYALCESTLTGGLQAEAMACIRNFSKHFTH